MAEDARLLDRLWETLFSRGMDGLVSPADIRRHGQERRRVRAGELREVARVQRELLALAEGALRLDALGRLNEVDDDDRVHTVRINPLIEQGREESLVTSLDTGKMLTSVGHELAMAGVRRELVVRHIAILAEEEMLRLPSEQASDRRVDSDWLMRWRLAARDAVSMELKRLWARMLAGEVLRPGTYSIRTMEFLRNLSRSDREMIGFCARFCFDNFIYRNPGRYFSDELHRPLFENLDELGILRGVFGRPETWLLASASPRGFRAMLPCRQRAIYVEGAHADDDVRLPVYRLTRFGRELLSLFFAEADTAYLAAVAGDLKKKGFSVRLGDWIAGGGQGLFSEKVAI